MPKISVITSTFNRSKRLKKTIDSVLNQEFKDFELIIVDDCSTDDTKKIIESYNDDRIVPIYREENHGHDGKPKNEGLKIAKGEYITFLDDDDLYYPEALKILYKYITNTGADVVYGDYLITDKKETKPGWSVNFDAGTLSKMNFISMCVAIIKKESILAVGGLDEDVPKFKDWNLWLRMQKNGSLFAHVPIIVTNVIFHKNTISKQTKVDYDEQGHYLPTYFSVSDCKIYPDNTVLGKRKKLKVAVFTLTLDRLEYTKKMIKAARNTAGYDFSWIVLDQNSQDGTVEFIKEETKYGVFLDKNIGIAKGWDKAIEEIKRIDDFDIVVKLDNDAEMLTDGWLKTIVDIFEINKKVILSPYVEGLQDSPGGVMRQRADGESPYIRINDNVLGIVPNLGGICFATPIEVYKDFKFPKDIRGNKDYYLSKYAQGLGYALAYMEEFRVYHQDGTEGQHKRYPEYFKKLYG